MRRARCHSRQVAPLQDCEGLQGCAEEFTGYSARKRYYESIPTREEVEENGIGEKLFSCDHRAWVGLREVRRLLQRSLGKMKEA